MYKHLYSLDIEKKKMEKQVIFSLFDAVLLLKEKRDTKRKKKCASYGEDAVIACARGGLLLSVNTNIFRIFIY